ncbi:MAG: rod shape-determining protein MreD [Pusillimonas sp.]|jgi:rod shape-determining protein MreD|nr:rod shape-determining protein MreD [Pusillimonas sp.]MBC41682.1 rod shape-determining protein MreD [Pusillimonas sp.]HCN70909.1 rod shape-determining protein MreD [Pusillimonas sp.]HCP79571.1 rod shape-determining protein MreD [Pusillimonas sp.]|tara:strand:- start:69663 stop:70223 length:561 start_codon:yes stop_codon:yes gene_type:complete
MASRGNGSKSSLSALTPIDTRSFGRSSSFLLVWGSILIVWLASLASWRVWPYAPDLLLLVLLFWCLHEPRRVGLFTAFMFGLLMDVHDAGPLGGHALVYGLAAYGVVTLSRRLQRFNSVVQAIHILPVLLLVQMVYILISSWLAGHWLGWAWLVSAVFTAALWPVADILLHYLPHRLHEELDGSNA